MTTRTPDTVSSTTVASSADSTWIAITDGKRLFENRRASTLTNGSGPSASSASSGLMLNMIAAAASDGRGVRDRDRDHHDEGLHLLQVGVRPAHQLAGLHIVVEREVQALEVGEDAVTQHRLGPTGLAEGIPPSKAAADPCDHAGYEARATSGLSGTVMNPRAGRSRSKVTKSNSASSPAASRTVMTPRENIAR